jgi:hypothetical protein
MSDIVPPKKPKRYLKTLDLLNSKAAANTLSPKTYADLVGQFASKAYKNDELSYDEYMGIIKPLFGQAGEMVTKKIEEQDKDLQRYAIGGRVKYSNGSDEPDISKLKEKIIELMDNENLTFEEAYREAREEGYAAGGRVGFDEGTPKDFNRNPSGKNQYTANMRTDAEIQKIIDSKPKNWTKKDFRGEGKLNQEKILTRKETDRPGLKFYFSGKRTFKDSRGDQNIKQSKFVKSTQGSSISMDKINNFAHYAPKLLSYLTSTADTGPLKAEVNRAAEGYDKKALSIAKKQEKLITEKPKGYKYKLAQLNFLAANESKKANKTLPNALKGTLGFFTVNPDTGKFTLKGVDRAKTFAGISGEKQEYKKMDPSKRAAFGPTQSIVQNLIDKVKSKFPDVKTTRASNVGLPQKTLTANMFKSAFKGAGGGSKDQIKDPLGGPDLIDIKKLDKNPYNDN